MNAGFMQGDILLLTDGVDSAHQNNIQKFVKQLRKQGYQLSIIGIGSNTGSPIPIPNSGGFIKDKQGQVILTKLNSRALKKLAAKGGGQYHKLSLDDSDFQTILEKRFNKNNSPIEQQDQIQQWIDSGGYIMLFILPLVLFIFRRGLLSISFLLLLMPLFYNDSVQAETSATEVIDSTSIKQKAYKLINSDNWKNLWMTEDQRGQKDFNKKQYSQAAKQFNNPLWKGGAHYRAGEFDKAIEQYEKFDDAESLYNKANALANLQKYEQAIENYDSALKKEPNLSDAKKSRDYVKQLLAQQKQQEQEQQQQQDSNQESSENNQQDEAEQQKNNSQDQQQQDSEDEQQTDSESDEQQQDEQENNSSQQAEQNKDSDQDQSEQQQEQTQNESRQEPEETKEQQDLSAKQEAQETDLNEGENATEDVLSQLSQEEQQSLKQWLQRIPDNPGELLRIKFRNNSLNKQRQQNAPEQYKGEPW
ncbi:MAG: tetratricopeptide repeat protein [Thiotrichaceae bacterium]|nr:tetratricopeptide repeat protein [Thiotrichaceae bacterium]